jgi:hypothetical protein
MNVRKIINPKTNRFVNVGTQKYKRLVSEGVIQPVDAAPAAPAAAPAPAAPAPAAAAAPASLKVKLIETATDIVKENANKFSTELTQEQTDRLLKKLLYEKLCIPIKAKKKKKPKEKKKKPKFKVVVPPNSSESESESESQSESE